MLHVQAVPFNTSFVYGPAPSYRKHQLRAGPRAAKLCAHSYTSSAEWQKENPSFDDIVLNDEYYDSLGISPEELAEQLSFQADDADPEGQDIGMDGPVGEGSPSFLHDQDLDIDVWGPEAVVLAGFKAEECAIIRCTLDAADADSVKVLPCTSDMLYQTVDVVLEEPEVDWSQPRPDHWGLGRDWGSQRVILFSGLGSTVVLSIIELLEGAGLPPLCIAVVEEADAETVIGELLAAAVKAQRGRKNPKQHVWEDPDHVTKHLPDIEELIGQQARHRIQAMQQLQPQHADAETPPKAGVDETDQTETSDHVAQDEASPDTSPGHAASHDLSELSPVGTQALQQPSSAREMSKHAETMAAGIESLRKRRQPASQQAQPQSALSSPLQQTPLPQQQQLHQQASSPEHQSSTHAQGNARQQQSSALNGAYKPAHASDPAKPAQLQPGIAVLGNQDASSAQPGQRPDLDGSTDRSSADAHAPHSVSAQQPAAGLDNLLDAIIAGSVDALPKHNEDYMSSIQSASVQPSSVSGSTHDRLPGTMNSPDQQELPTPPGLHGGPAQQPQENCAGGESAANQTQPAPLQHVADATAVNAALSTTAVGTQSSAADSALPSSSQETADKAAVDPVQVGSTAPAEASKLPESAAASAARQSLVAHSNTQPSEPAVAAADSTARYARPSKLKLGTAANRRRNLPVSRQSSIGKPKPVQSNLPGTKSSNPGFRQDQQPRVIAEPMSAEEFHRLNALDANARRPAWASNGMPGMNANEPKPDAATDIAPNDDASDKTHKLKSGTRSLTRAELQALAERRGLDFERLLADAQSKGVIVESVA